MQDCQIYRSETLDSLDNISTSIRNPLDHLHAVCPALQNNVVLMQKSIATGSFASKSINAQNAAAAIAEMSGVFDVYFTPNEFHGRREASRLAALNAFYVDIDAHSASDRRCPTQMAQDALSRLRSAQMPEPNLVVYTGRGCHLYWLFHRTHKAALPRWYRVQDALCNVLNGDRGAKDVARVLRFVGSRNSQAPKDRLTATCETINARRYDFDWLCDQILPFTRDEIRVLRQKRAEAKLLRARSSSTDQSHIDLPKRSAKPGQIWQRRSRDLVRIAQANFEDGHLPQGKRNRILFYLSACMAWLHPAGQLLSAVEEVAAALMPTFSRAEIRSTVSTVLKRAEKDDQGVQLQWNGRNVANRYRFRTATLWSGLEDLIVPHEHLYESLEAIVPCQMRKERKQAADRSRDRVAEGRYTKHRSELDDLRKERVRKAFSLAEEGSCVQTIAELLLVTPRTVRNYLSEARQSLREAIGTLSSPARAPACEPATLGKDQAAADASKNVRGSDDGKNEERSARSLWWAKPRLLEICALSTRRDGLGATMQLFQNEAHGKESFQLLKSWLKRRTET